MTAITRWGKMVPTDKPFSLIGGLLDIIMIIFAICASLITFVMKPSKKKTKAKGSSTVASSAASSQ